eukprot:1137602-Pelagomonas_calceolata.AAC.3
MLHAMFAAARVGAESLDPYASLWNWSERTSAPASSSIRGQNRAGSRQSFKDSPRGTSQIPEQTMVGALGGVGAPSGGQGASNAEAHQHQQLQQYPLYHHHHHHSPPSTAAQHLESMLPWNRDPYLRVSWEAEGSRRAYWPLGRQPLPALGICIMSALKEATRKGTQNQNHAAAQRSMDRTLGSFAGLPLTEV